MTTKQLLSSNNYIQYPKFLGFYIGVNEAVLLSALCDKDSWCENYCRDYEGEFYFLKNDIELETGLSESQQRTALKTLVDLKIVTTSRHGCPSRVYYEIDVEILESVLTVAYNDYSQRKSQQSQNMTTSDSKNVTTSGIENRISSIDNNKDIKINNKAPAEPALSSTKSRRRDMINRSTNTLVDDLESGKDIDKQTSEQKKERKKKLEEDKAKARINKTEFSQEVKDLLYQFFLQSYHSNSDRRMRSAKDLEGKFNQLRKLIEQGQDAERVIQQSIENNWNALYDLRTVNKTDKSHEASRAICKEPTEEELKAWKESDLHF